MGGRQSVSALRRGKNEICEDALIGSSAHHKNGSVIYCPSGRDKKDSFVSAACDSRDGYTPLKCRVYNNTDNILSPSMDYESSPITAVTHDDDVESKRVGISMETNEEDEPCSPRTTANHFHTSLQSLEYMDQAYSIDSIASNNASKNSKIWTNSKSKTLSDRHLLETDPQRDSIITNQSSDLGQSSLAYANKTKGNNNRVTLDSFEEINKRTVHGSKKCFTFISGLFNRWKNLGRFNERTRSGISKQLCSCPQLRNDSLGLRSSCQELRTMSAGFIVVVTEGDGGSLVNGGTQYPPADDRDSGKASGSEAIYSNNYGGNRPSNGSRAPVAKMDSFETTSFDSDYSLNSNDLMLDVFDESFSSPLRFGCPSPKMSLKSLRSSVRSLNKKVRPSGESHRLERSIDLVKENVFTQPRLFQSEPKLNVDKRGYSLLGNEEPISTLSNNLRSNDLAPVVTKNATRTLSLLNGVDALNAMIYPRGNIQRPKTKSEKALDSQAASLSIEKRMTTPLSVKDPRVLRGGLNAGGHDNDSFVEDDYVRMERQVYESFVDEVVGYRTMLTELRSVLEMEDQRHREEVKQLHEAVRQRDETIDLLRLQLARCSC